MSSSKEGSMRVADLDQLEIEREVERARRLKVASCPLQRAPALAWYFTTVLSLQTMNSTSEPLLTAARDKGPARPSTTVATRPMATFTARTAPLAVSHTYATERWVGDAHTPRGLLNRALKPLPPTNPGAPGRPATVDTMPEARVADGHKHKHTNTQTLSLTAHSPPPKKKRSKHPTSMHITT